MGGIPSLLGRSREVWDLRWVQHKSESAPARIKTEYNEIHMASQPQTLETTEIPSTGFLPTEAQPCEIQSTGTQEEAESKEPDKTFCRSVNIHSSVPIIGTRARCA